MNKGATVIAVDRNISNLKNNGHLRPYELDITDWTALKKLYCDVLSKYGRIDVVVNNAGLFERIPLPLRYFSFSSHLPTSIAQIRCPLLLFVSVFLFRFTNFVLQMLIISERGTLLGRP